LLAVTERALRADEREHAMNMPALDHNRKSGGRLRQVRLSPRSGHRHRVSACPTCQKGDEVRHNIQLRQARL